MYVWCCVLLSKNQRRWCDKFFRENALKYTYGMWIVDFRIKTPIRMACIVHWTVLKMGACENEWGTNGRLETEIRMNKIMGIIQIDGIWIMHKDMFWGFSFDSVYISIVVHSKNIQLGNGASEIYACRRFEKILPIWPIQTFVNFPLFAFIFVLSDKKKMKNGITQK